MDGNQAVNDTEIGYVIEGKYAQGTSSNRETQHLATFARLSFDSWTLWSTVDHDWTGWQHLSTCGNPNVISICP